MKLLCPEVTVVPGRIGAYPEQAVYDGMTIPGSSVVRLINDSPRENAFTVRVEGRDRHWRKEWYSLLSLPITPAGGASAATAFKKDDRDPDGSQITVYVPRDGVRDVLIRFNAPRHPLSHAGVYPFQVVVDVAEQNLALAAPDEGYEETPLSDSEEEFILGGVQQVATTRGRRYLLAGHIQMQPYYDWSIDLDAPQTPVTFWRRTAGADLVITNRSNDWLYCEIEIPPGSPLQTEAFTQRIAVPPDLSGETLDSIPVRGSVAPLQPRFGVQRHARLHLTPAIHPIFGPALIVPVMLNVVRVDAPSFPLTVVPDAETLANPALMALALLPGEARATLTQEVQTLPLSRAVIIHPAAPPALTGFLGKIPTLLQIACATLISVLALGLVGWVGYQYLRAQHMRIDLPRDVIVAPGQAVTITGNGLDPAETRFFLGEFPDPLTAAPDKNDTNALALTSPTTLGGKKGKLRAQRYFPKLRFLNALLPQVESQNQVSVLAPPPPAVEGPSGDGEKDAVKNVPASPPASPFPNTLGNRDRTAGPNPPASPVAIADTNAANAGTVDIGPLPKLPIGAKTDNKTASLPATGNSSVLPNGAKPINSANPANGVANPAETNPAAKMTAAAVTAYNALRHALNASFLDHATEALANVQTALRLQPDEPTILAVLGSLLTETEIYRVENNIVVAAPLAQTPPAPATNGKASSGAPTAKPVSPALSPASAALYTIGYARPLLEAALNRDTDNAIARVGLGEVAYLESLIAATPAQSKASLEIAASRAREALLLDSALVSAHYLLASILLKQGQPGRAQLYADQAIVIDPKMARAFLLKARILDALKDPGGAQAARDKARAIDLDTNAPAPTAAPAPPKKP